MYPIMLLTRVLSVTCLLLSSQFSTVKHSLTAIFQVFIEYLEKRESRLPNFLTRVALLQDEIADLQVEERGTTAATRREVSDTGIPIVH